MKVLLVDDEVKFVMRLAERLNIRGIEADWVSGGKEALEKVETESFDVAVLDVKMPGMSGIELKRQLAEKQPEMKFILVTGHGSESDYHTGSQEAAFYILKPFNIDTLVEKLNQVVNQES
jgi:DNA-binding response OmpR family regulator